MQDTRLKRVPHCPAPTLHTSCPPGMTRPRICITRFDIPPHVVHPNQQPPPHVPTVMRLLSCNHPDRSHLIMNYLIDHVSS